MCGTHFLMLRLEADRAHLETRVDGPRTSLYVIECSGRKGAGLPEVGRGSQTFGLVGKRSRGVFMFVSDS